MNTQNPLQLMGIEFVEFSSPAPQALENLFYAFGFSKLKTHPHKAIDYFLQNDIHFLINSEPDSHAQTFAKEHGPCISSMGWRFKNPNEAYQGALSRGARAAMSDYENSQGEKIPAIYGIGNSMIYFIPFGKTENLYASMGFVDLEEPVRKANKGFLSIDHLTNNVEHGTMQTWAHFYKSIFGFTEVRYFDIKGVKTGLTSYALKSPCGTFCIPINEASEEKSQINEYLREYHGPGIQHLAFLTEDILYSLDALQGSGIETLDIDSDYYDEAFQRVKNVKENKERIKRHKVLVDGDESGYLLQIFTKNIIGPIFIEIIQRNNHYSFGERNFKALFRSIERDQAKRGVL